MKPLVITIDGPAGAGKSTVAKKVASRLGLTYLDTGAMYRALTLSAINTSTDVQDGLALRKLAESDDLRLEPDRVILNGQDVSSSIRQEVVSSNVSVVACHPEVREYMTSLQRKFAKDKGAVLDGRDMGSVVFPDADIKIFLTATVEKRTERRYLEMKDKGIEIGFEDLKQKILDRDKIDSERKVAPLIIPEGAYILDTTDLTIEEAVQEIVRKCRIE